MSVQAENQPRESLSIGSEAADQLFFEACNANTFSDEPVSDEVLEATYETMKMGPTLMDNQPMRIA
ncbi:hypothetical protein ACT3UQ_05595 [Glutamicibacter sp. AOP12-B1-11]|uniref:hypothetical protein n=1 Tax=Glutamicibacter sp. AOP12-B1-11 TaxID=3457725 RepID=UPI004034B482